MTSPHHPYPTLIRLPLELIQASGALMVGGVFAGLIGVWQDCRRTGLALCLWTCAIPLFLMLIVALDYQKQSYALLAMAPTPLLVGWSVSQIKSRYRLIVSAVAIMLLLPYGISAVVGPLPVDERQHIDHSYDPRDDLSSEQLMDQLGSIPAPTPRVNDGFGTQWVPKTMSLMWEGGLPRLSLPDLPAPSDLTVLWASLQGDLPKPWRQRTTDKPSLPPDLVGQGGVPGKGPVSGRTGFVVALTSQATDTVKVAFHKTPSGPVFNVTTSGEPVSAPRYVNVIVVDRAQTLGGRPRVVINGEYVQEHVVWMRFGKNTNTPKQALVVSNIPWGIGWVKGGFRASPVVLQAGPQSAEIECESPRAKVLRTCIESECVWTLTGENDQPIAHRVPDARGVAGERWMTWSDAESRLNLKTERCVQHWLAVGE